MERIKKWINRKLPLGSFARNVVTLMTGTTFAQALLILIAPILTRLYTPEDFGVYALYTSILGILTVIACLRYELAIVVPEKDEDAANILALSIIICTGMCVIVLFLTTLFRIQLSIMLDSPDLASWLWFLPISLLSAGLFMAFNYWSTRRKHFKRLAVRQVTLSSVTAVTQILAGANFYRGSGGLIIGYIAGQAAATARLGWQIWKEEGRKLLSYISIKRIKCNVVKYKHFPLFSSWSGLLNKTSVMIPPLLLGYFFSPAVVGFYALGHRVLMMPMSLVGNSVSQVFFPRAVEAKREKDLDHITFDIFQQLLTIGLVPILLISIIAPQIFVLIFGDNWLIAGEYVRWLSIWIFFQFVSSPISTIYIVLDKQRELLLFNIVLLATRLVVLIIGGWIGDALLTIKLFGISGGIIYFGFCIYILYSVGISLLKIFKIILNKLMRGTPYVLAPLCIFYFTGNTNAFVVSTIISGIVFLIIDGLQIVKNKA